ncbi:MAG: acyltransferase family protein [Myxococcales bacterium]|nr:acyltransferase family protein [Myxococcales bacterium]
MSAKGTLLRWRARARRLVVREALPAVERGLVLVRDAADDALLGFFGPELELRMRRVVLACDKAGVDPFGFQPEAAKYAGALMAFFHRGYFRTRVFGIDQVPKGRVLLIANHSGQLPVDAMLIGAAMFFDAEPPRFIRSMVEKWTQTLPFVGTFLQRVGQVVGVPENARRLLEQDEAVLVFPEGSRGISKPFRDRYRLTPFGLGFMRLALETNTPIVPIGVVGGEEQYISLGTSERLAGLFGMPIFPLVPQWLIPGGQLPLPTRYRLYFGAPLTFDGDPDDEDTVIDEKVGVVCKAIEKLLAQGLAERTGIFR